MTADKPTPTASSAGLPTKCVSCHRDMDSPAVCDYCHTLYPVSGEVDYFRLLGVPQRYDLDGQTLRSKYLSLNRQAHPDFHTAESQESRDLSLDVASSLNNAYRTLAEPVSRAEYLMQLLGGKSSAEDKSAPEGFLGEVMLLREEIDEARAGGDAAALEQLARTLKKRLGGMMDRLAAMFAEYQDSVACEAARQDELARIRRQLNAISYVRRLLEQTGA